MGFVDSFEQLKLIVDKKLLSYNYHKLIQPNDLKNIFKAIH